MSREPLVAVIDDDEPFRTALVESLGTLGFAARGFASAEEFVAAGEENWCDCVITDIHMSGMDGFELTRRLVSRRPKVPVIMITARAEQGLETRAAAAGAACLLKKPFEATALVGCIDRALGDRERMR